MLQITDNKNRFYVGNAKNTPRATNSRRNGRRIITAVICILIMTVWMTACESIDVDSPPETEPSIAETEPSVAETEPPAVLPTSAELPRLDINTEEGAEIDSKEDYTRSTITLSNCDEEYAFSNVAAGIRLRGNSTAAAPKKPYRIKFDVKQAMLGLTDNQKFRSWCLLADYYDHSMLRTYGTFKLAKALLDDEYFSADCTYVEVYINGQYQGLYLLCDQTQVNEGRVDIPKKKDGDTSLEQGYLLIGQGGRSNENDSVVVKANISVVDRNGKEGMLGEINFSLSGSGYTEAQKAYVSNYCAGVFKVVEKAVYDNEYYTLDRNGTLHRKTKFEWAKTDEEKQIETVSAVFNIESAVSMCILDEIVKNLDAMTYNMYVDLSPDGDGVLTLAAPWDFDFSMGNTRYHNSHTYKGFYATNLASTDGVRTNYWYVMLGNIDWFEEMCREKWQEVYPELKAVVEEMNTVNIIYDEAFTRDYELWGLPSDRTLTSHHLRDDLATFTDHKTAGNFVINWLEQRLWWLNAEWGDGIDAPPTREPAEPAPVLELTFDSDGSMVYIDRLKKCEVELVGDALCVRPIEKNADINFSFNYRLLSEKYSAEDYYILEFTYLIPKTAVYNSYTTQLFLCAGDILLAYEPASVSVETYADGEWHTVRIDLSENEYWERTIYRIRMDIFDEYGMSDVMYLKNFKLLPK